MSDRILFRLVTGIVWFCFIPVILWGQNTATVFLKDSTQVHGILLQYSSSMVRLDPDGAISLRIFYADQIDSMRIEETGETIYFVSDQSKKETVNGQQNHSDQAVQKLRVPVGRETEPFYWSMGVDVGPIWNLYDVSDFEFEQRQFGNRFILRYHPRAKLFSGRGEFMEIIWLRTQLIAINKDYNYYGVTYSQEQLKTSLNIFAFNYGLTFFSKESRSYFYFYGGLSLHTLSHGESVGLSNAFIGVRLGAGFAAPLKDRINLIFSAGTDFTYTGKERDWAGQEHATSAGGIFFLTAGLMYDFGQKNFFDNFSKPPSDRNYFGGWGEHLGIGFGLNIASARGSADSTISSLKRIAMEFYTVHTFSDYLTLQPGIRFSKKGYVVNIKQQDDVSYFANYLELNALMRLTYPLAFFTKYKIQPALLIGPVISINTDASIERKGTTYNEFGEEETISKLVNNEDLKDEDIGLIYGFFLGFANSPLKFSFQHEIGFSRLYSNQDLKNTVFSLLLQYEW